MIKFDKNEFLKPQIYSTNDKYETRCNVNKEIVDDVKKLQQENQELKKQIEEKTKIGVADHKYASKCEDKVVTFENQQKKFIDYLENEKYKLAGSVSHTYEDSLGKTRFVNEDIFNEVDTILSKYKEIIEGKDEK